MTPSSASHLQMTFHVHVHHHVSKRAFERPHTLTHLHHDAETLWDDPGRELYCYSTSEAWPHPTTFERVLYKSVHFLLCIGSASWLARLLSMIPKRSSLTSATIHSAAPSSCQTCCIAYCGTFFPVSSARWRLAITYWLLLRVVVSSVLLLLACFGRVAWP
jgi:hypothetical protein